MKEQVVYFDNIVDDVIYYIGTNASDNFRVIDMGKPDDIWFHAKDLSSCHVVAQIPDYIDKQGIKTIIKRGVQLCKQNTNKLAIIENVDFIYTKIKNVMKTDVDGCVITKHTKVFTC